MSCSFIAAVAKRTASLTMTSDDVQYEQLFLATLPHDLLVLLAERMLGEPTLAFTACCKALRAAGMVESSWSRRLKWELGFTTAGISGWLAGGRTLVQCFLYHFVKHEALEVECLRVMPVRTPGWRGCHDVRVCLEFVNRWPVPIWTFVSAHAFASSEEMRLRACADTYCSEFEASHGRGETQRVLSFARGSLANGDDPSRPVPPGAQHDTLLAQGWVVDCRVDPVQPMTLAVPATIAVPVAAQPELIALSEVTLRIDQDTWAVAEQRGALVLHVLQAVDVAVVQAAEEDDQKRSVALDAFVATTCAEEEETGPFHPSSQARPLSGGRSGGEDRPSSWVFLRSRAPPVRLAFFPPPTKPPEKLVFTALRHTEVALELDSL